MNAHVSLLITTYNNEKYVERALRSALNQTYPAIQIIVVDDHSTDETWKKLQQFRSCAILIRHHERRWVSAALNTALGRATGAYITRLDGDDKLYPRLVEREVAFLEAHPECGYVYCDYHVVDTKGRRMQKPKLRLYAPGNMYHVDFTAVGTMIRRECFGHTSRFDPEMHLQEMYEFYLRVLRRYQGGYLPEKLWAYTRRPGQATSPDQHMRFLKYTLLAIEKNYSVELGKISE